MSERTERARLLFRDSRPREAEQELRGALAADPDDVEARALLAICLTAIQEWDQAAGAARAAIRLAPEQPFTHGVLAVVLHERGDLEGAELAAEEAANLDPHDPGHWSHLARIRLDLGNPQAALATAELGLGFDPDDAGCLDARALALVALGGVPGGRMVLDRLVLRPLLWIARLSPSTRWGVVLAGAGIARPYHPLALVWIPLVLLTWIAAPLSDLVLRLSRSGRRLLTRDQVVASNWLGAALAAGLVALVAGLARDDDVLVGAALAFAFISVLVVATFALDEGRPRRRMAAYAAGCALVAVAAVAMDLTTAGRAEQQAGLLLVVSILGVALATWRGSGLRAERASR